MLTRLVRDLEALGIEAPVDGVPEVKSEDRVLVTRDSALKLKEKGKDLVFFEDLDPTVEQEGEAQTKLVEEWADYFCRVLDEHHANLLKRRFAVVPDSTFDFLTQQGTEINTRIRIDSETKWLPGMPCGTKSISLRKQCWEELFGATRCAVLI